MLNKLSAKIEESKTPEIPDMSTMLQEQSKDGLISDVDWSKLENIIDLSTKVPSVRFFAGTGSNGQKGCVKCQVCFDYLCSHDNGLRKCDPLVLETDDHGEAAAKHIRKYRSLLFIIYIYIYIYNIYIYTICIHACFGVHASSVQLCTYVDT